MVENEFSSNGGWLPPLSEHQSRQETRYLPPELCLSALLSITSAFCLSVWAGYQFEPGIPETSLILGALFVATMALLGCFRGFATIAEEDGRLPNRMNGLPTHDHITGLGAAVVLLITVFVFSAGYAGQKLYGHFVVPEWVGQTIVVGLFVAFALFMLFSRLLNFGLISSSVGLLRRLLSPLDPLGRLLSRVDAWLVFIVAPTAGATLRTVPFRYFVLLSHIVLASWFAWFGPAPFGLAGTAWAILVVVAVNRRWSWIETERAKTLNEPDRQSLNSIELDEDLRDEAIWSILLLMLILPIGMRQFELMFPGASVFQIENGAINRLDAWTGFFGVELLKALPFLDWADIYQAQGQTRVSIGSAVSMHVLLLARAMIDLVFLSALVQAIAISVSLSRNRRDFLAERPGIDRLDERIEQAELTKLAYLQNGEFKFRPEIQNFLHYNTKRLSILRSRAKEGSRLLAVIVEIFRISQKRYYPPIEQLLEVTARKKVNQGELNSVLTELEEYGDFDLQSLMIARRQLNWKAGVEAERQRLVGIILRKTDLTPEREKELADILIGDQADSLNSIRVMVVQTLAQNAQRNPDNILYLSDARDSDRSKIVRDKVKRAMQQFGLVAVPQVHQQVG
ncbi:MULTISPECIES: hypothetical protein [unclassified Hyphomonas]|uniref:hypothetical protein n=1 Tax=unclassified Hyphomonas TaxID=2630699 RepID=UPI000B0FC4AD|nr:MULTISPECIES: hypothetical protein [unclassified Hyphomonas]